MKVGFLGYPSEEGHQRKENWLFEIPYSPEGGVWLPQMSWLDHGFQSLQFSNTTQLLIGKVIPQFIGEILCENELEETRVTLGEPRYCYESSFQDSVVSG